MASAWYVYMLECADGSFYTGITVDLERRVSQHNGKLTGGSRFTRGRRPVRLVWFDAALDRSSATKREAAIKKLSRAVKRELLS